ncbi:MAG: indole-3-glycerol phosphate synthase TrpC [Acidobacteriota bacterium]
MDILTKIVEVKRKRLAAAQAACPLVHLQKQCRQQASGRFQAAIARKDRINIIAEIKKASPSKGLIRADCNPLTIAQEYQAAGAAAISILTEEDFFQGSLDTLRAVREHTELPLLRKDFIFDEYQVYEAAAAGADAFLLIAAMLSETEIINLAALGNELGLAALVEVHTAQELEKVLNSQQSIIGVNNRDLRTFEVDLNTSLRLAKQAPKEVLLVSESGINTTADIERLRAAGYQAFLIGEQLMRAESPGTALTALLTYPC